MDRPGAASRLRQTATLASLREGPCQYTPRALGSSRDTRVPLPYQLAEGETSRNVHL